MIESSLIHDGYTADLGPSRIALQSLTAPTQAERDVTNSQLHAAGLGSGSGGSFHSDIEAIEAYFSPIGARQPSTGKKIAVAAGYGPITTPYMVYFSGWKQPAGTLTSQTGGRQQGFRPN